MSERDLAVSIVFIVKTSPASLIKQVLSGRLITSDSQVQSWALFKNPGSAADLAGLTITNGEARTLARASPGSSLNLSRAEIAAFNAVPDGNPAGVLQTLRAMLLARRAGELLVDEVDHTGHHDLRAPAPNGRRRWRCLGRGAAAVLRQRGLQWPASGRGLPADPGRHLVVYTSRAFTDQITGFGGSMRRSMGRRVMANQIKEIFEAGRKKVQ